MHSVDAAPAGVRPSRLAFGEHLRMRALEDGPDEQTIIT
jgi:hypothetical protein